MKTGIWSGNPRQWLFSTHGLQHLEDVEQSHIRLSKSTMILGDHRPCLVKHESLRADQLHELGQLGRRAEIPYRHAGVFRTADGGQRGPEAGLSASSVSSNPDPRLLS